MITVPVTSAECERSFSKLVLKKKQIACTFGQQRLEKLLLCSSAGSKIVFSDTKCVVDFGNCAVDCVLCGIGKCLRDLYGDDKLFA